MNKFLKYFCDGWKLFISALTLWVYSLIVFADVIICLINPWDNA